MSMVMMSVRIHTAKAHRMITGGRSLPSHCQINPRRIEAGAGGNRAHILVFIAEQRSDRVSADQASLSRQ